MKINSCNWLIIITCFAGLTGCVGIGSKFDCNVNSGGKCAPMQQINKLADAGVFHNNHQAELNLLATNKINNYSATKVAGVPQRGAPLRSNETVQQIWLGPYEDNTGNYHAATYVYSVVKKAQWLGEPTKVGQE